MAGQKLTVSPGWSVVYEGQRYENGAAVEVDDKTAEQWTRRGWATQAADRPAKKATPKKRSR